MNCKPGDLAVICKTSVFATALDKKLLGRIVRVTHLFGTDPFGRPCWAYEPPFIEIDGWEFEALGDHTLTPIREKPETVETHDEVTACPPT